MRRGLGAIVALTLLAAGAHADQPRRRLHFSSPNGRFVLVQLQRSIDRVPVFDAKGFVGLLDRRREEDVWGLFDARTAVRLDSTSAAEELEAPASPLYTLRLHGLESQTALVDDGGRTIVVLDDFSEATPGAELEVLRFFVAGERVAAHTLGELLTTPSQVHRTVSHFRWFDEESLDFDGERLELVTTEGASLRFDASTGALLSRSPR